MSGELTREFKVHLIKAVFDKNEFDQIMTSANPYQLSDIQEFLWEALLYVGRDEKGEKLTRDAVTSRMLSTVDYWRSQLCGEPLDTCRGRSCFVSHPVCAGNKLRGQIEVIRQMFDRRRQRADQEDDALMMTLMYYVNENDYAAAGLYKNDLQPRLTVGSRVLDGPTLHKVIAAMTQVVHEAKNFEVFTKVVVVGDARLMVHARRCDGNANSAYVASVTPEGENSEKVDLVMKKIDAAIKRIQMQTAAV
jgi:hypothetical protein